MPLRSNRAIFAISLSAAVAVHAVAFLTIERLVEPFAGWGSTEKPAEKKKNTFAIVAPVPIPPPPDGPKEIILGKQDGAGDASNESAAWEEAIAKLDGPKQAALQRDAAGQARSSSSSAPPPRPIAEVPETFATATPAAAFRDSYNPLGPPRPKPNRETKPSPTPDEQKPSPPAPKPSVAATPQPPTPPAAPPSIAGKPIEQADRDSDLFGDKSYLDARPGRMVARNGRGFQFARPKANLAAYVDTATLDYPVKIVFELRIDPIGRVQDVTVVKSSGSRSLDRVVSLALYESTFDPIYDNAGKPMAEVTQLPMQLY